MKHYNYQVRTLYGWETFVEVRVTGLTLSRRFTSESAQFAGPENEDPQKWRDFAWLNPKTVFNLPSKDKLGLVVNAIHESIGDHKYRIFEGQTIVLEGEARA